MRSSCDFSQEKVPKDVGGASRSPQCGTPGSPCALRISTRSGLGVSGHGPSCIERLCSILTDILVKYIGILGGVAGSDEASARDFMQRMPDAARIVVYSIEACHHYPTSCLERRGSPLIKRAWLMHATAFALVNESPNPEQSSKPLPCALSLKCTIGRPSIFFCFAISMKSARASGRSCRRLDWNFVSKCCNNGPATLVFFQYADGRIFEHQGRIDPVRLLLR